MPFSIRPTLQIESVLELTVERLAELGVRWLLLDVDCTLKRYSESDPTAEFRQWLDTIRQHGIAFCLVSNGRARRIRPLAERMDAPYVAKALKPLTRGVRRAMKLLEADPAATAMVGDQLFADVLAGNLAGIRTILVRPMHPEEEPWFTRLKRRPERWALKYVGQARRA